MSQPHTNFLSCFNSVNNAHFDEPIFHSCLLVTLTDTLSKLYGTSPLCILLDASKLFCIPKHIIVCLSPNFKFRLISSEHINRMYT